MSTIELQNLTKAFGDLIAVNDVSLKVEENEVLCLLGPSGCGKTTTLRMVAGLEVATSGDILIANKNVNDLDTRDRNLAMAFQFYALYPSLTVAENLANPLHAENLSAEEVKKKTQALVQSSMKLGEAIYKTQQKDTGKKSTQQNQGSKKEQNKENVVDADFEEVKDDKSDKDKEKRA